MCHDPDTVLHGSHPGGYVDFLSLILRSTMQFPSAMRVSVHVTVTVAFSDSSLNRSIIYPSIHNGVAKKPRCEQAWEGGHKYFTLAYTHTALPEIGTGSFIRPAHFLLSPLSVRGGRSSSNFRRGHWGIIKSRQRSSSRLRLCCL